jgi:hypothetical protein
MQNLKNRRLIMKADSKPQHFSLICLNHTKALPTPIETQELRLTLMFQFFLFPPKVVSLGLLVLLGEVVFI